jgi:hypothetical protein
MRVTWTQFEAFIRCPLWYSWTYQTDKLGINPRTGQETPWTKDTSHLARGNATQSIVDQWALDQWYKKSIKEQLKLVNENLDNAVYHALQQAMLDGIPKTHFLQLRAEIYPNLCNSIPVLNDLLYKLDPQVKKPPVAQLETFYDVPQGRLYSRIDLVLYHKSGEAVILEGKATRKPSEYTQNQLRWEIETYRNSQGEIAREHYYLFYTTAKLWPIRFENPIHSNWLDWRNEQLLKLKSGENNPTPGPFQCRICPHSRKCPWKHVPQARVSPVVNIKYTGTRTSSLD